MKKMEKEASAQKFRSLKVPWRAQDHGFMLCFLRSILSLGPATGEFCSGSRPPRQPLLGCAA
jgi:hypothetical protein